MTNNTSDDNKPTIHDYISSTINKDARFTITARPLDSSSGLGNAHESLFGVLENNDKGPDVPHHNLELKASLDNSKTLVTLFSNAPKINLINTDGKRKSATRSLVETYALVEEENEKRSNLYISLHVGRVTNFNGTAFSITHTDENYFITADEVPIVGWTKTAIENSAMKKLGGKSNPNGGNGALLLTKGKSIDVGNNMRECSFSQSTLFQDFDIASFHNLLNDGSITVDIRAHSVDVGKPSRKIRDHGTAFRISEKKLGDLYRTTSVIL